MDTRTDNWSGTAVRPVWPDHSAKRPEQSRNAIRSTRRFHHAVRAVLDTQSFRHTEAESCHLSAVDTWRRAERTKPELRRYPRHAFTDMRRRQCRMDGCSPF